jgi:predicted ATPase
MSDPGMIMPTEIDTPDCPFDGFAGHSHSSDRDANFSEPKLDDRPAKRKALPNQPKQSRGPERSRENRQLADSSTTECVVFARLGEYWSFTFRGATFVLKDSTGLAYIQRLLQNPSEEFHSIDLFSGVGVGETEEPAGGTRSEALSIGRPGDAGEMLDAQAKREYRERLRDLRQDLEVQRERGDVERAARTESEIDFLTREIARAVGLGGRDRRAGSTSERARLNVLRAIRAAIAKIAEYKVELAELLNRTIKTGTFCSYVPDEQNPVRWRFSLEDTSPAQEMPETGPLLSVRQTAFIEADGERTAFVGRENERSVLRLVLARALRGERKLIALSGAPGVGKTRLANEFRAEASRNGFITLGGSCYEDEAPLPFGPFIQMLEAAMALRSDPEFTKKALGNDAAQLALLLPQVRKVLPELASEAPPDASRSSLLDAVVNVLSRLTGDQPLFLMIDDLHWADEGTLSLLAHLARTRAISPILIVVTYRERDWSPAGQFAALLDELVRIRFLESMTIEGLPWPVVKEMIHALSGLEPPSEVVSFLYSGTEGNPFFIEELFRHLHERGKLLEANGQFRREFTDDDLRVPPNLKAVIGRRLARTPEQTRSVLSLAAVLGRTFTFRVLEAASDCDSDSLINLLEDSERQGLLVSHIEYPEALFHFSHELIRKSLLEGLSSARLQRSHLRIADAIERVYADAIEGKLNDLAYHLSEAGTAADPLRTSKILAGAAQRALSQSAYEIAVDYSRKALRIIERLGDHAERNQSELTVQIVLGNALMATRGYGAAEVESAFARARLLSTHVSQTTHLTPILFGLFMFYLVRGHHNSGYDVALQLRLLADQRDNRELLLDANVALGGASFYRGEFAAARTLLEEALTVGSSLAEDSGSNWERQYRTVLSLSWAALSLWSLGFPQQAADRSAQAIILAREIGHPFSQAYALTFDAVLHQHRREWMTVETRADEGLRIASEHHFALLGACNTMLLGWVHKEKHQGMVAVEQIVAGLQEFERTGAQLTVPYYLALLAEAYGAAGKPQEGLATLSKAQTVLRETNEHFYESEILRLKGELLLGIGQAADSEAESALRKAIDISRGQGARSFELRAAMSLAELRQRQGRPLEEPHLIETLYHEFNEGLDTPDLLRAKQLLNISATRPSKQKSTR